MRLRSTLLAMDRLLPIILLKGREVLINALVGEGRRLAQVKNAVNEILYYLDQDTN